MPTAAKPTCSAESRHDRVRRPDRRQGRGVTRLGVALCALCAVAAATLTVLLTPLYWGAAIMPISVLLAVAANVGLPLLARRLGAAPLVSGVPFLLWIITVLVLGMSRPEGDVLLPAGTGAQPWVTYGMLAAGTLAGGVTVMAQTMGGPPAGPRAGERGDVATPQPEEKSQQPAEESQRPEETSRPQETSRQSQNRPRQAGRTRGRR